MRPASVLAACALLLVSCGHGQALTRCAPEAWEGECQLSRITKVVDAEFPIPHIVLQAIYEPLPNAQHPTFTPGAMAERRFAKSEYELPLYDFIEAHARVACRTVPPADGACISPRVAISLPAFDPEAAASVNAPPPVTGCAQIEATSAQDSVQNQQPTQSFVSQRVHFAESSAELPPDADQLVGEVAQLLEQKPNIECLGVVGQIASGEPQALAEQRARAVRDLLAAHGIAASRLLTIAVTAKVFGSGTRPEEADPADRRVSFSVLLEHQGSP